MQLTSQVLVIGAGPVGLFTAYRLAKAGISVTVLEKDEHLSQLPRAGIYYPPVQFAFQRAGLWDALIAGGGFRTTGLDMRLNPVSDGQGGKKMGRLVACFPKEEDLDPYGPPTVSRAISMLNLPQPQLAQVLLDETRALPNATVLFHTELVSIDADGGAAPHVVRVTARDTTTGATTAYAGAFLVGADGARSRARALLGVPFQGHTWPDKIVATDVWLRCHDEMPATTTQVMDPVHYAIVTPLAPVVPGEVTKWRVSFALDPEDLARGDRPLEAFLREEYVAQMYDRVLGGPRPVEYKIDRVSPYTMHQRLASTLKRGRCLLAGDTAHINTVIGGLGLSNCILGAEALSEVLIMIIQEGKPAEPLMKIYSDERRQAFQFLIDPVSSWNKFRLQAAEPDDWFFSSVEDTYSPSYTRFLDMLQEFWPTKVRAAAEALSSSQEKKEKGEGKQENGGCSS